MIGGLDVSETGGRRAGRHGASRGPTALFGAVAAALAVALLHLPAPAAAQEQPEIIQVSVNNSEVLEFQSNLQRISIGNPNVVDAVVVSAREVVLNGKQVGSTSFLTWSAAGERTAYTVQVTTDAAGLGHTISQHFPDEDIEVSTVGRSIVLSGRVSGRQVATDVLELARRSAAGEGVQIVDNLVVPEAGQVMLHVRFAEVNRSAMKELGVSFLRADPANPQGADEGFSSPGQSFGEEFPGTPTQTFSDAVNFFLFHEGSSVSAFIRALQSRGNFKSLAEPNLLAMPGDTASFLAGGEFPFPVVQGTQNAAVTIQFREFGIRLTFVPTITNSGAIRLNVEPEVSQLDFSQGLVISGFQVPAILSRRAATTVELRDGQTFAIAGLMDNTLQRNVNKVPFLGDIPILGALFRSEDIQQNRTELLVLVTPRLVGPQDEAPPIPTGEPDTWKWDKSLEDFPAEAGEEE